MRKKIARITLLGISGLLFFAAQIRGEAQAQGQGNAAAAQKLDKLEEVSKELKLTPEQKVKLLPILKEEAPKLEEINKDTSLTNFQKMPQQFEQLQSIRKEEIQKMVQARRAAQ
jgi:coenzyme F420-reducing hydrogenase delta subunit